MAYNLQTSRADFRGGINILASEHVQFIEVGGTMDATAFPVGTVAVGTLVARDSATGKFVPYTETTPGTFEPGLEDPAILNVDFVNDGVNDTIVGELIVRGSVYEAKLATEVPEGFKAKNDNIRYVKAL